MGLFRNKNSYVGPSQTAQAIQSQPVVQSKPALTLESFSVYNQLKALADKYVANNPNARYQSLGNVSVGYMGDPRPALDKVTSMLNKVLTPLQQQPSVQSDLYNTTSGYSPELLKALGGQVTSGGMMVPKQYVTPQGTASIGNGVSLYDFGDKLYSSAGADLTGKYRSTYGTGDDWWVDYLATKLKQPIAKSDSGKYYVDPSLSVKSSDMDWMNMAFPVGDVGGRMTVPGDIPGYSNYGWDKVSLYSGDKMLGDLGFTGYRVMPSGDSWKGTGAGGSPYMDELYNQVSANKPVEGGTWRFNAPKDKIIPIPGSGDIPASFQLDLNPYNDDAKDVSAFAEKYFVDPQTAKDYTQFKAYDSGGGMMGSLASLAGMAFGMPVLSTFGGLVSSLENKNPAGFLSGLAGAGLNTYMPEAVGNIGSAISGATGIPKDIATSAVPGMITGGISGGYNGGVSGALTGAALGGATAGANTAIKNWNPTGINWLDNAVEKGTINLARTAITGGDQGMAVANALLDAAASGTTSALSGVLPENVAKLVGQAVTYVGKNELTAQRRKDLEEQIAQEVMKPKAQTPSNTQADSKKYERIAASQPQSTSQYPRIGANTGMLNQQPQRMASNNTQSTGMMRQQYSRIGA